LTPVYAFDTISVENGQITIEENDTRVIPPSPGYEVAAIPLMNPLPELQPQGEFAAAHVTVVGLMTGRVHTLQRSDDPFFLFTQETSFLGVVDTTAYNGTYPLNAIGRQQAAMLCNFMSNQCTPWLGWTAIMNDVNALYRQLGLDPDTPSTQLREAAWGITRFSTP
jgi:hypothetical protein